jgi:uncharacterized protein (UPF0548 family)
MAAAARRAEREGERRQRQFAKEQISSAASHAVSTWQDHMREVVTLHVRATETIDWEKVLREPEPPEPLKSGALESEAQARFAAFQPRFWHFLGGGVEKRRARLEENVAIARAEDDRIHQVAIADHLIRHAEWTADRELAKRLLDGEIEAQREVLAESQSLSEEGLIGTRLSFLIAEDFLHAIVQVHGDEVVPKVRRKQLQSGRLSESKMPVGEANELYQDYVCSVALRVANDLLGLLPRNEIYVTCIADMLDRSTGHMSPMPILSVRFVRDTFERLSLSLIDPSDSMRNFVHEMNFKRASGFSFITPLKALE